jgi:hypothetical protein
MRTTETREKGAGGKGSGGARKKRDAGMGRKGERGSEWRRMGKKERIGKPAHLNHLE